MLEGHERLYYRGTCGVVLTEPDSRRLAVGKYRQIAFYTYFNGCSVRKWKTYTSLKKAFLFLEISGSFQLSVCGCSLRHTEPEISSFGWRRYDMKQKGRIEIEIPEGDMQTAGLKLHTLSDVEIYGGGCIGEFADGREVNLSVAVTTCRKEAFVRRNIAKLHQTLLCGGQEIGEHLFLHITDNGGTLGKEDFPEHEHIFVHTNKNTGGSGGFARGMIESMRQNEQITHIQLMDDDVVIEPESIYRTYILLKHLKKEYRDAFISGAMLYMENPSIQKEDVGMVSTDAMFLPLKQEFNQEYLWDNLMNEKNYPQMKHTYAAWWYCCIPVHMIRKHGLPLPVFVRGDDVEYGLRCRPGFLTMNGICVWHMGFAGKVNAVMDFYQVDRNLLIIRAVSGVLKDVKIMRKLCMDFVRHLLRFDYDTAQLVVRALEDYLKGPAFLEKDCGERLLVRNSRLLHEMKPLKRWSGPHTGSANLYEDLRMGRMERLLYKITWNGHLFKGRLRPETMPVPYQDVYLPGRTAFRKKLLAVNPVTRTGYLLERDRKRFCRLLARFVRALYRYRRENRKLMEQYAASKEHLTSETFWKKYLGI